jgi:hypothetical protein
MLDTGAEDLILYQQKVEGSISVRSTPKTKAFWSACIRPVVIRQVYLGSVRMKDTTWENLPAFILENAGKADDGIFDGVVGAKALGLRILNLDYQQGVISWIR